jgi:TonB-linked SusC/RagA family outer membrane protein
MKKNHPYEGGKTTSLTKLLKIMKLAIILLLCTFVVHAGGFSQNAKVTLSLNGVKLTKFFKVIEKETDYRFAFSNDIIPDGKIVSVDVKETPLYKVMDAVLMQTNLKYRFDEESGIFIISQKNNTASNETPDAFNRTITGTVTRETGEPLDGVSVHVKGKNTTAITDNKGFFSIEVGDDDKILEFSFIGMIAQEVNIEGKKSVTVVLALVNKALGEVVVIGYGTQKRALVTSAVSSVNGKTLNEIPALDISQALQGRVAGLQVTNNGSPGTQPIVRIRGISSISFAADPMYVVDGFPTGDLATIDTRDIESIDVLKDASAAAIYGSRATSGVIMITTKKGRRDSKIAVNLDSYVGFQQVTQRLSLMNTEQFMQYALTYRGSQIPRLSTPQINEPVYPGATQTYGQTNTDWQDAYFKTGFLTQHNVSLSGGNDISRVFASAGFTDQDGTSPSVGYRRYNFRINSDHVISKYFTFGENLYVAQGKQNYDNNEAQARTNLVNVIRMMPHIPVYDPTSNGGYRGVDAPRDGGDPTNPVEDAELKNPGTRSSTKIFGTAFLEINFTKWLKFRSTFGADHANTLDYRFSPIFTDNGTVAGSSASQATITNNRNLSTVLLYTEQLTFDKTFGKHHVNVIGVIEQQNQETKLENGTGKQPTNNLRTLRNATDIGIETRVGENSLISYVGRVNYDYRSKYILSAAIRRDGLSVWAPGKKWATFPSASIGWRVDQEKFMQKFTKISELKLRVGYGVTGLNGVLLGFTPWLVNVAANSAYYPFNNSSTSGPVSSIPGLGNPNLEWEKTNQLNIGFDLGLFRNKITLSAEYYRRKTNNLILAVPIPPSYGFINNTVNQNVGAMTNNGFELQLGYNKREGKFKWNASTNLSIIKNKVTRLAEGVSNIEAGSENDFGASAITNTAVGQPVQSFYGWEVEGIFQTKAEVASHATQVASTNGVDGTQPGDLKFKDQNGDGVIDSKDRVFLGSFIPKFSYGVTLGANYKNFDLSLFFQGVQGNKIYNATRVITEGMIRFFNAGTQVLNAWTPTNTATDIPRAISGDPNQNSRPSTRFLENGSYLRMKNIMLSYTIPGKYLSSLTRGTVKNFRVYISAQNLLTFTKYSGYDPEVGNRTPNSSLTSGIDYAVYPQPKSYIAGVQVGF